MRRGARAHAFASGVVPPLPVSDANSVVDNIAAGGMIAPTDPETGELGCGGRRIGELAAHPVTGAQIEGFLTPDWQEAKALVIDAHAETFPDHTLVGWDVALSSDGPILSEGDSIPGLIVAQRAPRRGAGDTRYGQLLAHHLAPDARP